MIPCFFYGCEKRYSRTYGLARHVQSYHGLQIPTTKPPLQDLDKHCIYKGCEFAYDGTNNLVQHLVHDHGVELKEPNFKEIGTISSLHPSWLSKLSPENWTNASSLWDAIASNGTNISPETAYRNLMEGLHATLSQQNLRRKEKSYVESCLAVNQSNEMSIKNAFSVFDTSVEEPAESPSSDMLHVHDTNMTQKENENFSQQSEKIMLGRLVGISPSAGLMKLDIWNNRELIVGHGETSDFMLSDPVVSSRHCRIFARSIGRGDSVVCCEDLSKNGTHFNRHRIGKGKIAILLHGCTLHFSENLAFRYTQHYPQIEDIPMYPMDSQESLMISNRPIGYGNHAHILVACRSDRLSEQYACKQRSLHDKTPEQALRIRRELEIMRKVAHHACIVGIRGDHWDDGVHSFLVMPIYHGGTLADWMNWRPDKDQTENSFIMRQTTQAVKHLHELGIVHRNIKPENIFLPNTRRYPRIVIGGFGNAIDLSTTVPASDELSALEQFDGPHYQTAVDNWTMGALFYTLWTGLSACVPPDFNQSTIAQHSAIDKLSTQWNQVDDEAGLLTFNPAERLTALDCLHSSYLVTRFGMFERLLSLTAKELY
ncbi:hypothetical protein INT43_005011 [Umbelopsis isabellina]|uniref:Kinase-like protein n=1 Tax=Mortierella isabellina TaxID=91625 RepID=A0A8H7PGU6_MORIS|nr:hypothetical protein INT43_005011 [Umbelopsis isabellina]